MNLTISLPVPAVQLILDALAKLPYEQSAPVIREIETQGTQQLQAAQAAQVQQVAAEVKPDPEPKGEPEAAAA